MGERPNWRRRRQPRPPPRPPAPLARRRRRPAQFGPIRAHPSYMAVPFDGRGRADAAGAIPLVYAAMRARPYAELQPKPLRQGAFASVQGGGAALWLSAVPGADGGLWDFQADDMRVAARIWVGVPPRSDPPLLTVRVAPRLTPQATIICGGAQHAISRTALCTTSSLARSSLLSCATLQVPRSNTSARALQNTVSSSITQGNVENK